MGDFVMPSLGADMDRGRIVEWRVAPGDTVHRGDIVAVVGTDKSDIDVEVFQDGTVLELLVEPGRDVPVGTPLARLSGGGDGVGTGDGHDHRASAVRRGASAGTGAPAPSSGAEVPVGVANATRSPRADAGGRILASPRARALAAELHVDLAAVTGTGIAGAVVERDVEAVAASAASAGAPEAGIDGRDATDSAGRPAAAERQASMRRAIGELMARSKREVPHYYLATTVDLDHALAWLEEHNRSLPVAERVLPAALLLKATALAAAEVPALNGSWLEGFVPASGVHLGVAISLRGGGLVAPAIHDVDRLGVDELMASLHDLVARARRGRLRSSEMSDPTLTVTNLGDQGAEEVFGVIYPPQVALVGFGRVVERPRAVDGMLAVRPTVRATLAADHRATDGHEGSRFLAAIDRALQDPAAL